MVIIFGCLFVYDSHAVFLCLLGVCGLAVTADRHVTHVYRSNFHSGYDPGTHLGFCAAFFIFATDESAKL